MARARGSSSGSARASPLPIPVPRSHSSSSRPNTLLDPYMVRGAMEKRPGCTQAGAMVHPVFGVLERSPRRRSCGKTTAAAAAASRRNVKATAGRNFGSVCCNYTVYALQAIAAISLSVYCLGLGYMINKNLHTHRVETGDVVSKNLPPSENGRLIETGVASEGLRPSEIDWVKAGVVSSVARRQNNCGSCWAMAVVASVEALHYLNTKQSITLSAQELIDCDIAKNNGCKGGWSHVAFEYILKNGISAESSYPYIAQRSIQGCKQNKTAAAWIHGFRLVDPTEDALEEAVAKQPVIVDLQVRNVDDMWRYKGGIMDYETLPPTLPDGGMVPTHSVLIVGYGTTNGVKYWRFKNSWGNSWGEGGFGRIRRHVADKQGALGIFRDTAKVVYPVLNM